MRANQGKLSIHGHHGKKNWKEMKEAIFLQGQGINQISLTFLLLANLLKEISIIRFDVLQNLNLSGNNLLSIECLPFLLAPNLRAISLRKNLITCTRILSKVTWGNLSQIYAGYNPYPNLLLSKAYIPELVKLDARVNYLLDIRYFAKLQTKSLTGINIKKSEIERKNRTSNTLIKKWKELHVQKT